MTDPTEYYAVGFRIMDGPGMDCYGIWRSGHQDRLLTHSGRLLFVRDLCSLEEAMRASSELAHANILPRVAPPSGLVCDVPRVVALIEGAAPDEDATIVDSLNMLFDCLATLEITPTSSHREVLWGLADHATFHRDPAAFLTTDETKALAIDGLCWMVGCVAARSYVLDRPR